MKTIKVHLLLLLLLLVGACSTGGVQTNSAAFFPNFANGDIRLTCGLSCAFNLGANRQKLRGLYNNGLWKDLATEVAAIGSNSDQQYYYLGAAAQSLGYLKAAKTYYALALSSTMKCGGSVNVCDDFVFPRDINTQLSRIQNVEQQAAAQQAAAQQAAAQQAASAASQQIQKQNSGNQGNSFGNAAAKSSGQSNSAPPESSPSSNPFGRASSISK